MAEKKAVTLLEAILELKQEEDCILIKWNRQTGHYTIFFSGKPMPIKSMDLLLKDMAKTLKENTNEDGIIKASLQQENNKNKEKEWKAPWEE